MANRKKKQSIADQINETLKPRELIEEDDEIEARFEEFDENNGSHNEVSNIRRQQAVELSELDSKYKGKAVSRKELQLDIDNELDSESEEQQSDAYSTGDSEEELASEDGSDEATEDDDDDDDDYGDIDLAQFTSKQTDEASENPVMVNEADEEVQKGMCVQNQLKMWEKLLEVRIKSQKMLITANSLPDFDACLELTEHDTESKFLEKCESICDNVYGLLDNLLELQSTLTEKFTESRDVLKGVKRKSEANGSTILKRSKLAEYSDNIEEAYDAYKEFGFQVLQKWHDRTKNLRDSKNKAVDLSIRNKIESALLGKNQLIRKTQIYRGDYEIFGIERPQEEIELSEIYDDTDFYHQLLRELIEYKSNVGDNESEITQQFVELQKVRNKMKKKVETRASKGRKIRYNVHNKLVNFMPPNDSSEWTDEAKTELFNSLFGSIK